MSQLKYLSRLHHKKHPAISLIETVVGIAVFVIIATGILGTYTQITRLNKISRLKTAATALANEYMEIARNLPYSDVGVISGIPNGVLSPNVSAVKDNTNFNIAYSIKNIDDPFDGTIGGSPNDTSPADYKLATVTVSCTSCQFNFTPITISSEIAPRNLEIATDNGALIVQVLNANGQPVPDASVHVENNAVIPAVNLNETTDDTGILQLIDVPPAEQSYRIIVTKSGYSTDRTYSPDDTVVINPIKTDATVLVQEVTMLTFTIDLLSALNISSLNSSCAALGSVDFNLTGSKLISTDPDIYKYSQNLLTNSSGQLSLNSMEWDSYTLNMTDSDYELLGTIPLLPINLAPDSSQDYKLIMKTSTPHSYHVIVRDASTQLPVSGASIHLTKSGYDETIETERGYIRQTNWKNGSGQVDFNDEYKYFSDDGYVEVSNPTGELKLKKSGNKYYTSGYLISSTFDAGSPSDFISINWLPGDQPSQTGTNSLKFQIATNNDNSTWNFKGPDGTSDTYYTSPGQTINSTHDQDKYLRYKVYLSTTNNKYTPNLSEIYITYISTCTPPGQAFFTGLTSSTYTVEISHDGYQTYSTQVDLSPNWVSSDISLIPN